MGVEPEARALEPPGAGVGSLFRGGGAFRSRPFSSPIGITFSLLTSREVSHVELFVSQRELVALQMHVDVRAGDAIAPHDLFDHHSVVIILERFSLADYAD